MKRLLILTVLTLAISFASSKSALANFIYLLDVCKASDGCTGAGPYGTVALIDDGAGNVKVEVKLAANEAFASTSAGASFLWDLLGGPKISIVGLAAGFTLVSTNAGVLHEDGTGSWMYAIDCTGCGNGGSPPQLSGPLDFTILGESAANFIENSKQFVAASDICFGATGRGCTSTGDVASDGVDPPPSIPEPPALALFGAGLMVFRVMSLTRRRATRKVARNS